ncbi:MAG: hypothetical protein IJM43_09310 [Bacteroidaceae bacterium]|nr:hypothetical protein [Bacteroidaceae bacterium]
MRRTERIQVGDVRFAIDMPLEYHWSENDNRFLVHGDKPCRREVHVVIRPTELPSEPQHLPVSDEEGIRVWVDGNAEVRSFRAFFLEDHALYAVSRWQGDRVDIQFKFPCLAWGHPNMVMWPLVHLENQLLLVDGLILHSCYTQYGGKAILFTAPSGTGKTTQGNLWKRMYGSDIVNGDLCLLRLTENRWRACGYPMSGSAPECKNESYPIKAVVVVRQAPCNYIEELSGVQKLSLLYSECTVNTWNSERVSRVLDLLSDFVQKVPVVMLHCNLEDGAASTLHRYLYGE